MSTDTTPRPITATDRPIVPCWLWGITTAQWYPLEFGSLPEDLSGWSHWAPYTPPEPPPPPLPKYMWSAEDWRCASELARKLERLPDVEAVVHGLGLGRPEVADAKARAKAGDELVTVTRRFFFYLDVVEESDEGREFHPVSLGCCRAAWVEDLNYTLAEMRRLSIKGSPAKEVAGPWDYDERGARWEGGRGWVKRDGTPL